MRRPTPVPLFLAVPLLFLGGCQDDSQPLIPTDAGGPEVTVALDRFGGPPPFRATLVSRTDLPSDVVHYEWEMVVGPGPFDVIGLHRVVREPPSSSGRPVKSMEGVMLLPGAPQLFDGIFLPEASPTVPDNEGSVALYLASHGVDVWGMDYGWTAVEYGSPDLSHLAGWGIAKDTEHAQAALTQARWVRATSGQGAGPIHVLGFSYGGFVVYAVAADDTQRPGNLKNVKGIIPVDGSRFKDVPGSSAQASSCAMLPGIEANLASGVTVIDRSSFKTLGQLAVDAPDEPSALVPPFTNYQAALVSLVGAKFLGGSFTTAPPSVTLLYSDGPRVVDLLARGTPPYIPYQWNYDYRASRCGGDAYPVGFDNHLGEITVPILYLARQDGGLYTTTVTSSGDVTSMLLNPNLDPSLYGHADFFLANNGAAMVWNPILEWIQGRR